MQCVVKLKALRKVTASVQNYGEYEHTLLYIAVWFRPLHVRILKMWYVGIWWRFLLLLNLSSCWDTCFCCVVFVQNFLRGLFVLCFLDIVAGKFKNVRGKGDRRGSTGTEMRSYALHCAMDWMGNCSFVCVHYVTPLHGWLSKAVLTLIQLGTLCVLFIFITLYLINVNIMNIGLKWCKSVELMFLLYVLIWNLSSEIIAVHVSACF